MCCLPDGADPEKFRAKEVSLILYEHFPLGTSCPQYPGLCCYWAEQWVDLGDDYLPHKWGQGDSGKIGGVTLPPQI